MHGISTNVVELYVYYILIMYYYVGYCRTIIILFIGGARGPSGRLAGGRARGGGWQVADSEGFPLAPSRLAARGSPRLAPRLARLARVYEGFTRAVTVTGAAAVAVTVAVRGSGYVQRCVSRKERERERERERAWRFPEIHTSTYLTLPPARPAGN